MQKRDRLNLSVLYKNISDQLFEISEDSMTFLYSKEDGDVEIVPFPKTVLTVQEKINYEQDLVNRGVSREFLFEMFNFYSFLDGLPRNSNGVLFPRRGRELVDRFLVENGLEPKKPPVKTGGPQGIG